MEGAAAVPDQRGDARFVRLLRQQGAGRVLGGGRGLHVEAGEGQRGQLAGSGIHPSSGRVELGEQGAVLVVGLPAVDEGEYGRVLQLACPGVADRALVRGGRREADLRQVVAVDEVGQDEGRVHRGDHAGEVERVGSVLGDGLGHRLGFDGVPQFDDGQPGQTAVGQPLQLGHQVLAERAAGAVVDEGSLTTGQLTGGIAYDALDGAVGRSGQVVVEGDAAGDGVQQSVHDLAAGVGVEPGDEGDGQGHLRPP